MDTGTIGIIISAIVGTVQILNYLRAKTMHKENTVNDELDSIREDINQLKIENGICDNKHKNTADNMREQIRALEKILDRLGCDNDIKRN